MVAGRGAFLRPLIVALVLASCCGIPTARSQQRAVSIPDTALEPLGWREVTGWSNDDHAAAFDAFLASCKAINTRKEPTGDARPIDAPLAEICREAVVLGPPTAREARDFFETRFRPVRISKVDEADGFLTGYYEPIVAGSRVPTGEYTVPMYRRPSDLIAAARPAGASFPNKGGAWRRLGRKRVPYFDRGQIEDGALDGKGLEICWLKDPADAFFIHIQGSARVRLEDGAVLRLNYDAHNGHRYTPIGSVLVKRNDVPKEAMSMDRIREWMLANPAEGKELRRQNRSFIFFRIAELADHEEAVGAQGIPVTSLRSIAIDRKLHAYGTPFWIDAELPLTGDAGKDRFRRLMIAQDTGSAIVGPARADIYFGAGDEAGRVAGRIKHPGRFVMLVPRNMGLSEVASPVPYPPSRPAS